MSDMQELSVVFAKLAGLHKIIRESLSGRGRYFDPPTVLEYFHQYSKLAAELRTQLPELYADLPERGIPEPSKTTDFEGRGYITTVPLGALLRDLEYVFEVRANSKINQGGIERPRRVFISHGRSPDWHKIQAYIEKDLEFETLELSQEANRGRTVLQKLWEETTNCSYVVIVMTGDDIVVEGELPRVRENVMHEIGFFQGKYGLENVCLLYEEGTSIPSNIHGLVYIPYPKGYVDATFGALGREIKAAFIIR
jgi:hypothetical protein